MRPIFRRLPIATLFLFLAAALPKSATATFSIIACDPDHGTCGVAVATNNLAVGSSVCYALAGVGALVSQFETNPNHGPEGLRLLTQGLDAQAVLEHLLANDNNFEGQGIESRQVALINIKGQVGSHTGTAVRESPWAGARHGAHHSVQGNGLVGDEVLGAMESAFLEAGGPLAERLMAALRAGEGAGGQTTGLMSAALLVRTPDGWPHDVDLRVDAAEAPVEHLHRLLDFHYARQAIIRAERFARQKAMDRVWPAVAEALHRAAGWDRIWRRAARLVMSLEEPERAMDYLAVFMALNPTWGRAEIGQALYAPLRGNSLFQEWMKRR